MYLTSISGHHSLRSHSLLKMVFGQIPGNTYLVLLLQLQNSQAMTFLPIVGGLGVLTELEIPSSHIFAFETAT